MTRSVVQSSEQFPNVLVKIDSPHRCHPRCLTLPMACPVESRLGKPQYGAQTRGSWLSVKPEPVLKASIREGSAVQYASAGHRVRFETHGVNETLF